MKNNLRGNKGYAMVEVIAYVALVTLAINLGASAFLNQHRLNVAGMEALDRIREMERLSNDVRGLIRRAETVLPEGAGWSASEDVLVLALPPEGDGEDRIAIVGVLGPEDWFGWLIVEDGAAVRAASYRLDFEQVRVSLDADEWAEVRRVTFEFTPAYAFGEKREPIPRYVTAALRNAGPGGES